MRLFTREFLEESIERALKTAAQSAVLVLGAEQMDVLAVNWQEVLLLALGGFVLSIITSIASSRVGKRSTASLV